MTTGSTGANSENFKLNEFFLGWMLSQMMSTDIPEAQSLAYSARERIVFFLHTHFTCIANKVQSTRAMYFQNQLFRQFALDSMVSDPDKNFKTLTVKISIDNAMLRLLDGNLNVKGAVNENYGRELLELYSIGRGLEGTVFPDLSGAGDYGVYKEDDVQAAARVLSGWDFDETFSNLDPDTGLPRGIVKGSGSNASAHDNDPKQFTNRFDNQVIAPDVALLNGDDATEESALDEIVQLVDMIYSRRATVKNICWKIYRFFVYAPHEALPGPTVEFIDTNIIENMADLFVSSGYKVQPVIENLLRSQHFYEANGGYPDDNFGGIIKSPIDLVLGTLRTFGYQLPSMNADAEVFYERTNYLLGTLDALGLQFYEPFDVAGYEAYHQFPIYHRAWITPTALAQRYDFIRAVFTANNDALIQLDPLSFVSDHFPDEAPDAGALVEVIANFLLPVSQNLSVGAADPNAEITYERMQYFLRRFLDTFNAAYWSTNWNEYEDLEELRGFLRNLFNAMLQSPEYQLQ
jgi:uncharacterized protein (DUF1800 family)